MELGRSGRPMMMMISASPGLGGDGGAGAGGGRARRGTGSSTTMAKFRSADMGGRPASPPAHWRVCALTR
jgi:hypothetical protein